MRKTDLVSLTFGEAIAEYDSEEDIVEDWSGLPVGLLGHDAVSSSLDRCVVVSEIGPITVQEGG